VVAMPFMDARSAHVARAFGDGLLHKPGYAQQPHKPKPGLGDAAEGADPSELAYLRSKAALADRWKGSPVDDTDDNATMGITKADAPDYVQQMSLTQQNAYVSAFNQHAEENPEDGFDECDEAGREAIEALQEDSVEDACCPSRTGPGRNPSRPTAQTRKCLEDA